MKFVNRKEQQNLFKEKVHCLSATRTGIALRANPEMGFKEVKEKFVLEPNQAKAIAKYECTQCKSLCRFVGYGNPEKCLINKDLKVFDEELKENERAKEYLTMMGR